MFVGPSTVGSLPIGCRGCLRAILAAGLGGAGGLLGWYIPKASLGDYKDVSSDMRQAMDAC